MKAVIPPIPSAAFAAEIPAFAGMECFFLPDLRKFDEFAAFFDKMAASEGAKVEIHHRQKCASSPLFLQPRRRHDD